MEPSTELLSKTELPENSKTPSRRSGGEIPAAPKQTLISRLSSSMHAPPLAGPTMQPFSGHTLPNLTPTSRTARKRKAEAEHPCTTERRPTLLMRLTDPVEYSFHRLVEGHREEHKSHQLPQA